MKSDTNAPASGLKPIEPVIPANRVLCEFSLKAFILGILLSMILAAANAYIGLLVGMTVSASIPAAAVSLGVLRLFKKTNILENNQVQTAASAGESLVAGIIFTIPALVMMEGGWDDYRYWPIVLIALIGGILGVLFTIPLRRALIVDAKLAFPEGIATAEVLKTGGEEYDATHPEKSERSDEAVRGFRRLVEASLIGGGIKLLESGLGVLANAVNTTKAWFGGSYLFTGGITLSPALIGVGYIVGLNIAVLVFLGGVIGTVIGVPLNWALNSQNIIAGSGIEVMPGTLMTDLTPEQWQAVAVESWQNCRRIGVGAMLIGGLWSLISLARPVYVGIRGSMKAYATAMSGTGEKIPRTEMDTPFQIIAIVIALAIIPLFLSFYAALGEYPGKFAIAAFMTVLMLLFGFLFSSVAGYIAGLVGSSNSPISGVTIATVVVSALILLQIMGNEGLAATLGPIAVLYLAALICSAAAIAGDNMQDLKCGHLVGATPWRQQVYQVVGVVSAALIIPLVLRILDAGQGIGRPSPLMPDSTFLAAPQAGLMMDISTGIFGAGIEWTFIFIGCALAVAIIIGDTILSRRGIPFRLPVLAVAVGIYLPLGLSVPIFAGGLLSWLVRRKSRKESIQLRQSRENNGLLTASGLITGEALMGVLVAVAAVILRDKMPGELPGAVIMGLLAIIDVTYYLYRRSMKVE